VFEQRQQTRHRRQRTIPTNMRILIIRHADPEYNGDTLTEHGFKEAAALAKRLVNGQREGEGKLTKIFSSPMGRARDTARLTEEASGLKADVLDWCRELTYWPRLDGEALPGEGALALWDVSGETVRAARDLSSSNEFDKIALIAPAKQPYAELCNSSDDFLEKQGYKRLENGAYKVLRRNRDTIAVFCRSSSFDPL
jgi:Histidine phosphatase superfamily (branch 1)